MALYELSRIPVYEVKLLIKKMRGLDITGYKDDFVARRIRARMLALGIRDPREYLRYLRRNPSEVDKLVDNLSINVSEFFRDPWIWPKVQELIEKAINEKRTSTLRIWSAGCSRGEEPYTISIIVHEILGERINNYLISIYATDIDMGAINYAIKGIYHYNSLKNMPYRLLVKYFERMQGDYYKIKAHVKSIVKFHYHDLIRDPPLLFMDMVFCRNVLIYFSKELQERIFKKFYTSLRKGGYLVLGTSEYLTENSLKLFEVLDPRARIFVKK